jgi:tetratricopeptide (TPR) repeat protein
MNGVALAAPASFPLIILMHRQLLRSHLILVILSAAGIAGLLAFDFILGSLDWDLMSLMSFPLVILFAASAARLRADMRPDILIPACVICVLNTLPWIVINNTDASIRRLEDITLTEPANYFESHSRAVRVAVALRKEGFSRAAVDVLDRASALNPDDTVAQINRASIAREIDDFETTAQAAREVLRTEPWNIYAYRLLRGSLEKLGHHNELGILVKTHSERLVLRGKDAFEVGELTIAGMAYSGAAFMDLQNPGSLIRSSGAGKLLVEAFREAAGGTYPITFDKLPRQMRTLARRAYNASDKEAAVSYWATAKRMGLSDELIHRNQGVALIELGRSAEGLDTWRAGIRLNPGSVELRYILGTTLREKGEVDEAKRMLHEAIALEPTSARHYLQMGLLLQATDRKGEAIQLYKDALVKTPNNKDLEAALDAIQK